MEFLSFPFEKRQTDDDSGKVSGYVSVFGEVDSFNSAFQQGAFTKTIQEQGGQNPGLWFHDPRTPVSLGQLEQDDHGLFVQDDIDLDTEAGRDVFSGIRKGYIDRYSIGFNAIREDVDEEGTRIIKEARLFEHSFITRNFAANELALITDFRSMPGMIQHIVGLSERTDVDAEHLQREIRKLHELLSQFAAQEPSKEPRSIGQMSLDEIRRGMEDDEEFRDEIAQLLEETAPPEPEGNGTRSGSTPIDDDHLEWIESELRDISNTLEGSVS